MGHFNDLRLLHNFVAVYQQRSISGAARVVNCSQPALTRSIQAFEAEVGAKLFDRTRTGVAPTPFACRVYRRALSIIDEVEALYDEASDLSPQPRRMLNLGCGLACWTEVCDAIVEYQKVHPATSFNVHLSNARDLIGLSELGGFDVLIGGQAVLSTSEWLEVRLFAVVDEYLVVRSGHQVLNLPPEAQIEAVRKYPLVTSQLVETSQSQVVTSAPVFRANHHLMLFRALKKTDYYMPISEGLLEYARTFGLQVVGDHPVSNVELGIAYDPRNRRPEVLDFCDYLLENRHSVSRAPNTLPQ